jgi:1,2-phenylacetyl-CoA epoxidase catalytic subunit
MTNNKQQTEINAVEYLDKVNQFAKENNTDKPRQQTAVEWLWNQLPEILPFTVDTETAVKLLKAYQQAKEMEKEQIEEAFANGVDDEYEWHINNVPRKNSETYYNETYGGGKQ